MKLITKMLYCTVCRKRFSRSDNLKRHMKLHDEIDEEQTEEDIDEDEDNDDDEENEDEENEDEEGEESEDDSYVKSVVNDVFDKHDQMLNAHVPDVQSLEEYARNNNVEKYMREQIINKFAEDFNIVMCWEKEDTTTKWGKLARKRMATDDIDAPTAMKRVLHSDKTIKEWITEHIDDVENGEVAK